MPSCQVRPRRSRMTAVASVASLRGPTPMTVAPAAAPAFAPAVLSSQTTVRAGAKPSLSADRRSVGQRGHPDHWIVMIHRTGVPVGDVEVLA